jgi:simple sugar transport system ATP-binding protein
MNGDERQLAEGQDEMTDPIPTAQQAPAGAGDGTPGAPILEAREVSKYFGSVIALKDVSLTVTPGEVTCVLGDNGAGKSTLIKILSGVHAHDEGELLLDGDPCRFGSPREAREANDRHRLSGPRDGPADGDLAQLLPRRRADEGHGAPCAGSKSPRRSGSCAKEMSKMGIDVRDPDQTVGTLSGGERQVLAISRAIYFGARVLILDEPTSALGVKQSGIVLRYVVQARDRGVAVVFISHNPHHAHPVGDRFVILNRGRLVGSWAKAEITRDQLARQMAGGAELEDLTEEIESAIRPRPGERGATGKEA